MRWKKSASYNSRCTKTRLHGFEKEARSLSIVLFNQTSVSQHWRQVIRKYAFVERNQVSSLRCFQKFLLIHLYNLRKQIEIIKEKRAFTSLKINKPIRMPNQFNQKFEEDRKKKIMDRLKKRMNLKSTAKSTNDTKTSTRQIELISI